MVPPRVETSLYPLARTPPRLPQLEHRSSPAKIARPALLLLLHQSPPPSRPPPLRLHPRIFTSQLDVSGLSSRHQLAGSTAPSSILALLMLRTASSSSVPMPVPSLKPSTRPALRRSSPTPPFLLPASTDLGSALDLSRPFLDRSSESPCWSKSTARLPNGVLSSLTS